jgi:alpha,alpha-trehalase
MSEGSKKTASNEKPRTNNQARSATVIAIVAITSACTTITDTNRDSDFRCRELTSSTRVTIDIDSNLSRLLAAEDTDGDKKITVEDAGSGEFCIIAEDGSRLTIVDAQTDRRFRAYYLANTLQELKLAEASGHRRLDVDGNMIFENPVDRLSRSIRERFWDGLTRRIDAERLARAVVDEKEGGSGTHFVYVAWGDSEVRDELARIVANSNAADLELVTLPVRVTPEYVRGLEGKHGLLALLPGVPFVVPGGRFNEMYGWDSYFEALGLLADGRVDLARAMVDQFVYQIERYGRILNANRTYYLTRSQPPFLTSMALAVYAALPRNAANRDWLQTVVEAAIREYRNVWMSPDHLTEIGLSRYFGTGIGPPPEVEPGHFDAIYAPYAAEHGMAVSDFETAYKAGRIDEPQLDVFFVHDRCVRESGHDTTYRWQSDGDRCADFATVDLNSLLYKIEIDIAAIIEREFGGTSYFDGSPEHGAAWFERAARRKELMQRYLWDPQESMFFDFDLRQGRRHRYVSATTLYPLWAWHPDRPETSLVSAEQARALVAAALPRLRAAAGLAASDEASRGPLTQTRPARQWDYPYGWAPHQMIAWRALRRRGFDDEANDLIYRWLYTITVNAVDYNGTVPEKLDVVEGSHDVFAEYGNVGTKFEYITEEGFGWMNASYQVGLAMLPGSLQRCLERLVPPEEIDGCD